MMLRLVNSTFATIVSILQSNQSKCGDQSIAFVLNYCYVVLKVNELNTVKGNRLECFNITDQTKTCQQVSYTTVESI